MTSFSQTPKEILIKCQETPNPKALKFVANQSFKTEGKATFHPHSDFLGLPLIESLFQIEGVEQVYIHGRTLTFTHAGLLESEDIIKKVESVIQTRWFIHSPDFTVGQAPSQPRVQKPLSKELCQIEEILDQTIRPGLQADGGDVEVIRYENNEVYIMYQGACGGCPSAMMGTLEAIQSILSQELNNPKLRVYPI